MIFLSLNSSTVGLKLNYNERKKASVKIQCALKPKLQLHIIYELYIGTGTIFTFVEPHISFTIRMKTFDTRILYDFFVSRILHF